MLAKTQSLAVNFAASRRRKKSGAPIARAPARVYTQMLRRVHFFEFADRRG